MTTPSEVELENLLLLLENSYKQIPGECSLKKVRANAWEQFSKIGLPTKSTETYRYIKLNRLFANPYCASRPTTISTEAIKSSIYPECRQSVLVFVNGLYTPSLSNVSALSDKIVISTLNEATKTYGAFLNNQLTKAIKEETDSFAVVNTALHQDGIFIYVTPKVISEVPLQILNVISVDSQPMILMPRVHLFLGSHSQFNLYTSAAHISGSHYGLNQVTDIHMEEGSQLNHTQVNCNQPHEAWHLDALRAHLKRNCSLKTINVTTGSCTIRNDYRVALAGENAEVSLNGVWMLKENREAHTNVLIEHQAPYTRSNQLFKGILSDFSRSSFEGKIYVHQAAQKTEAFQLNNNLLLSDRAHADSKPNLEIFADDVKASHGATVGQLDPDQLFYMKTRGIQDAEAKNLLIYGYCQEILDLIKLPSLSAQQIELAHNYLK